MLAFAIFVCCVIGSLGSPLHVNPETSMLIDDQGRTRFFHGVNVVEKGFPWYPSEHIYNETIISFLEENGFNVIRLQTAWPGVEPEKGQYNETYLEKLNFLVKLHKKHSIYTLMDAHQDLFSTPFCGAGIPEWAVRVPSWTMPFPLPLQFTPFKNQTNPTGSECSSHSWGEYYLTHACGRAFQSLYNNIDNTQQSLAFFWKKVAQFFKEEDFVLGYELINEPWAGDVFKNPLLLVPGVADYTNLRPLYDNIQSKIREVDANHLIFFEPVTWGNFIPVGFIEAPGGEAFRNKSVLSYHYYTPPDISASNQINSRVKDIKRLKIGGMLTEFDLDLENEGIDKIMTECDDNLQSWVGWHLSYDDFNSVHSNQNKNKQMNGFLNLSLSLGPKYNLQRTIRTYAQAVAGDVVRMQFDPETKFYELEYFICENCGETEIYLNENRHYSSGFEVNITPSALASFYSPKKNKIHLKHCLGSNKGLLKIQIRRKDD